MNNLNEKDLERLGKYIVSQIRREMTMKDKNATKKLYKSLTYDVQTFKDKFELSVGVPKGSKQEDYVSSALSKGSKPSKFSKPSRKMVDNIEQWMKARKVRIRNRTKKGRYPKSRIRATAYVISKGILQRGIEGSKILETAFKRAERRVGDDVTKLYKDWIDDNVKKIIAEVNK